MSLERTDGLTLHRRTRRFSRRDVNITADFSPVNIRLNVPHNLGDIEGLVKNISPNGIFVQLSSLYRVGTRFQVRLPLGAKTVMFYVIVWRVDLRNEVDRPPVYGHGMKITTAQDDTLRAIIDYVSADKVVAN